MERHLLGLLPLGHRLQDLTLRDLQKQEREKAANSLEAFIFETQVGGLGHRPASGRGTGWGRRVLPRGPAARLCSGAPPQDKLYQPEYQEVSTEEQREDISGKLSAASTWLEDEGFGATTAVSGLPGHGGQDGERKESWSVRS